MTDFDKYRKLIADADRDDRVGDHDAVVTEVSDGTWPSGDTYRRVKLSLPTANNASVDFNLNELPTDDELAASSSWDATKKKAVASSIRLVENLEKIYGKSPETLEPGDSLSVKTVKNKAGFIRVVAILPKGAGAASAATKASSGAGASSSVPF